MNGISTDNVRRIAAGGGREILEQRRNRLESERPDVRKAGQSFLSRVHENAAAALRSRIIPAAGRRIPVAGGSSISSAAASNTLSSGKGNTFLEALRRRVSPPDGRNRTASSSARIRSYLQNSGKDQPAPAEAGRIDLTA